MFQKNIQIKLRKIQFYDKESIEHSFFLLITWSLPLNKLRFLYKQRWQVELFFKWIKQHLKIKSFWGTTENAVRIQIYSAIIAYCLVATIGTKLEIRTINLRNSTGFGISLLDKSPVKELLTNVNYNDVKEPFYNQLSLNLF
jgi:hypothetical protein